MRKAFAPFLFALSATLAVLGPSLARSAPTQTVDTFAREGSTFDAAGHPGRQVYEAHCAACHEGGVGKAPHREFLQEMAPEAIQEALTHGIMREQAAHLTEQQRRQVVEYIARVDLATYQPAPGATMCKDGAAGFDWTKPPAPAGWGYDNRRFVPGATAGLTAAQVPQLTLKWAYAFPSAFRARSQPVIAGDTIFIGSQDGTIYAFDLKTGCARWTSRVSAEVRTAIIVEPWTAGAKPARHPRLFFGTLLGRVHAMDAVTGELLWSTRPEEHPNATITGSPTLAGDTLYVPVSSLEVVTAAGRDYACCTFRGSVIALDIATGATKWQHYTVDNIPTDQGKTSVGTPIMGPSGAPVWNSPTVDAKRGLVYFGSGENYSSPADGNSDAVFAVDIRTGKRKWRFQTTARDSWNGACMMAGNPNCPAENGPDHDVAASVMLLPGADGRDVLIAAPKTGIVFALDPDSGKLLWQTRVGRGSIQGGVHFGMAAEGSRLYVPIADSSLKADGSHYGDKGVPGLHALDVTTGKLLWSNIVREDRCVGRRYCDPGISAAITAVPGLVIAGHLDGWLHIYDGATGTLLWQVDTTQPVKAVNGAIARGGSMSGPGPAVANGYVVTNSGYGFSNHMPGNALLVYGPAD
jgi:polyvinyl alcohol dehydrogenase (cytochrome)